MKQSQQVTAKKTSKDRGSRKSERWQSHRGPFPGWRTAAGERESLLCGRHPRRTCRPGVEDMTALAWRAAQSEIYFGVWLNYTKKSWLTVSRKQGLMVHWVLSKQSSEVDSIHQLLSYITEMSSNLFVCYISLVKNWNLIVCDKMCANHILISINVIDW